MSKNVSLSYFFKFFFLLICRQNTIRLWLPQLFASLAEYEKVTGLSSSMCTILEYNLNKTTEFPSLSDGTVEYCEVVFNLTQYYN